MQVVVSMCCILQLVALPKLMVADLPLCLTQVFFVQNDVAHILTRHRSPESPEQLGRVAAIVRITLSRLWFTHDASPCQRLPLGLSASTS